MGKRTIVLIVALLLAAVSAFSVWRYLDTLEGRVRKDINEVEVFRATRNIATGTSGSEAKDLIESSIALREVVDPIDDPDGTSILCTGEVAREGEEADPSICQQNPDDLDALLDGTVAAGPIAEGQLITSEMFVTPAELNSISLSESIAQGKVAVSIRPGEDSAAGGFIRPGDRVNMLASVTVDLRNIAFTALLTDPELRELVLGAGTTPDPAIPGVEGGVTEGSQLAQTADIFSSGLQFTQTVLQNLEVLAIGADTRTDPLGTGLEPQGTQIVVLEVTPEQSELIEYAKQFTAVTLVLLPDPDTFPYTEFEARGVFIDDLLDLVPRIQELLEPVEELLGN
jgi:Flp pilus assembly protein CpaB